MTPAKFRRRIRSSMRRNSDESIDVPADLVPDGRAFDECADLVEKELKVQHSRISSVEVDNEIHIRFRKPTQETP
jgi:hypothetical protein